MAKTYEELKEMGWVQDYRDLDVWWHKDTPLVFITRTSGEWDAEFRERMERNTPALEAELDWVTALRRAKNKQRRLQNELQQLEKEIEPLTQKVREVSLWNVVIGEPPMTWDELWAWATKNLEIRTHKIASHGNRVEFFGLKSQGSPLLGVAMRVGWPQDMEGDDE